MFQAPLLKKDMIKKNVFIDTSSLIKRYVEEKGSDKIEELCLKLIKKYQMKTLDSIQLSSGITSNCDIFLTSDEKLFKRGQKELKKKAVFI